MSIVRFGHVAMPLLMYGNGMGPAWCKRPGGPAEMKPQWSVQPEGLASMGARTLANDCSPETNPVVEVALRRSLSVPNPSSVG